MTSREKIRLALDHKPGPVPVDCGSIAVTGMHCSCVAALREHFGLDRHPVKVHEPFQMLGWVEDDLKDALGIDTNGIEPSGTIFGFANENWKTWRTPWNQEILVSGHFTTTTSPTGDVYIFPGGDRTAPPSGHMPANGYFFDAIIRQQPIDEDRLNPADNLEEFGPFSDEGIAGLKEQFRQRNGSARACVVGGPGTGLGDIALVPATFLKYPKGIRDVAEWYISIVSRPDYIHAIFSKQTEISLANLARLHEAVGDAIDVMMICGTDFGTQTSQFCSVETFRNLWKPYYQQMTRWIHEHTSWKVLKHSCGSIDCFLPDFIECGFDIINPVQCSAAGMDPTRLKNTYGDRLVFWGGGIDTQKLLPFGTPAEVRAQVLERCRIFSKGGGFVFNSIHNIQARTHVANIVAVFDAVREFNG